MVNPRTADITIDREGKEMLLRENSSFFHSKSSHCCRAFLPPSRSSLDLPPVDIPRRAARRRLDKGCFVLGTVFLAFRIPDQLE